MSKSLKTSRKKAKNKKQNKTKKQNKKQKKSHWVIKKGAKLSLCLQKGKFELLVLKIGLLLKIKNDFWKAFSTHIVS